MNTYCIHDSKDFLGESPVWDPKNNILYWTDMGNPTLNSYHFNKEIYKKHPMPAPLQSIILCDNSDLLVIFEKSLALFKTDNSNLTSLKSLNIADENIIFNDAKCDNKGQLWVGTRDKLMQRPINHIYSLSKNNHLSSKADGFIVTNGFDWSPDLSKLYVTDTIKKAIYSYNFDPDTGEVTHPSIFKVIDFGTYAYPDGLVVDSQGNIWSAIWGAGHLACYTAAGELDQIVKLPTKNISSLCFGGKDLNTLFVTSATFDFMGAQDLGQNSGGVFSLSVEIPGKLLNLFKT